MSLEKTFQTSLSSFSYSSSPTEFLYIYFTESYTHGSSGTFLRFTSTKRERQKKCVSQTNYHQDFTSFPLKRRWKDEMKIEKFFLFTETWKNCMRLPQCEPEWLTEGQMKQCSSVSAVICKCLEGGLQHEMRMSGRMKFWCAIKDKVYPAVASLTDGQKHP